MAKQKVLGVGFQKTGTSTLREALTILGYNVCDTKPELLISILKKNYKPSLKKFAKYDAAQDNPWPMLYREIDEEYPNTKFILTLRDKETWHKSVSRHIGEFKTPIHSWIYGWGEELPKFYKKNAVDTFEKHNLSVKEYFKDRPNDFLEINFTQGDQWKPLCEFLNEPIPNEPFPHYNDTRKVKKRDRPTFKRKRKLLVKRIRNSIYYGLIAIQGLKNRYQP